jgi:hypothetical protein
MPTQIQRKGMKIEIPKEKQKKMPGGKSTDEGDGRDGKNIATSSCRDGVLITQQKVNTYQYSMHDRHNDGILAGKASIISL